MKSTRNIKYMTPEEIERLFRVVTDVRDRAIFRVIYHRGLRVSELGMLEMSGYRAAAGRLYVHRLKEGHSGEYSLTDMESRALKAWVKERGDEPGPIFTSNRDTAISRQMLDVLVKKYCKLAKIPGDKAHCHALRHSCATSLLERGQDISVVQDHLGHANIANTAIYAKITNKRRDQVGKQLKGWK